MEYAVEIKPSQAKKLGHSSNLYIVDGKDYAYQTSSKETPNAIKCEITTRQGASKNRIGYLEPTTYPIDGLDPRPNHVHDWAHIGTRWVRIFSSS